MASHLFESIDAYIDSFPEEVKDRLYALKECVYSVVPDAQEVFNYNIPAFTLVEGGRREEQIMIAGYKKHVGLYPHPTTMEHFEEALTDYKRGKGSVQFPIDKPLPKKLICDMIEYRYDLIRKK